MSDFILSESHKAFNRVQKSRKLKPEEFETALFYFNGAWNEQQKKIDKLERTVKGMSGTIAEYARMKRVDRDKIKELEKALDEARELILMVQNEFALNPEWGTYHHPLMHYGIRDWLEQNPKEGE